MSKRKNHSPEFKAKVALEALKARFLRIFRTCGGAGAAPDTNVLFGLDAVIDAGISTSGSNPNL